ncbi:MAG: IS66 family transposase [Alphaproteobacteria bacterium HGW-Alphaproteobacteria-16]|nr:MAG: IS66 family transposase [Alphaproteobacteria bacterium HGW-Alphaproteobacteria-16]
MTFVRPTLTDLAARARADIDSRMPGADSRLRRSPLDVLAILHAGATHGLYGMIDARARFFPEPGNPEAIERWSVLKNVPRKAAAAASGPITLTGTNDSVVPAGSVFARADGARYLTQAEATIVGGSATVTVEAEAAGAAGAMDAGQTLNFVSPVAGVASAAIVAAGGLTGGADEESDAELSARIYDVMRAPPSGGKADDYIRWAKSVPEVTRVWVYENWDGLGTVKLLFVMDGRVDIIPASVKVIRHVRLKYACPCCQKHVATATKPAQPLGKSIAAPGLLAYIATAKYVDALPLYRQIQQFARLGIELDRTTLAHWMVKCGKLVQPLINRLTEQILDEPVVGMDETTVQVLDEPNKPAQSTSYMWVMGAGPPAQRMLVYHYEASRSGNVPLERLEGFKGALMADGYSGYAAACQTHGITRLGCWAHARRKFFDAAKLQPKGKTGRPDQALAMINKLYLVERQARDLNPSQRHQLRQDQARPVIDQLQAWLTRTLPRVAPKTKPGQALYYLQAQWTTLVRYLDDGRYPIDNNAIENAIRPFAIGRKNWLFSKSPAGARASANLYSLIETAKGHGIEPYAYLRHIFKQLPLAETVEDIDALLPQAVKGVVS